MRCTALAYDIMTGNLRDEVPYSRIEFGRVLNDASPFRIVTPKGTRSLLDPGRTIIYIDCGGLVASGMINPNTWEPGPTITAAGTDIWGYLARRLIRTQQPFAAIEQFDIVDTLITDYAGDGMLDLTLRRQPTNTGVTRTKTFEPWERKAYADAITDLAEADSGFEFTITAERVGGAIVNYLDLVYPRLGRQTNHVWQHGTEITVTRHTADAGQQANRIDGIGSGDGATKVIQTATETLNTYPRYDATISRTDIDSTGYIQALADAEKSRRRLPVETATVTLDALDDFPIGSWTIGDEVWISAHDTDLDIEGYMRIVAWGAVAEDTLAVGVDLAAGTPLGRPQLSPLGEMTRADRELRRQVARLVRT